MIEGSAPGTLDDDVRPDPVGVRVDCCCEVRLGDVYRAVDAALTREVEFCRHDIGYQHVCRAGGARGRRHQEPDRTRTGDQYRVAGSDIAPSRGDRPREVHTAPLDGRDTLRERITEIGRPRDVFGEGAVVRRGRHELHRLTEVVLPALAVAAPPTRHAGFESDTVARSDAGDRIADFDDFPGALVTENERTLDDVLADTTVFVVVDVRPTDTDVADSHENVVWPGFWADTVAELEHPRFD